MDSYVWFLLPAIIALGAITSYTDIKFGKIKNKWILVFLLYGIFVYLLYYFYAQTTGATTTINVIVGEEVREYSLFVQVISNFLVSLMFGFTIWSFNIWSAADAKLFTAFSFLLPLSFYTTDFIRYFPGLVIAINSIVIIIFYLTIEVLRKNYTCFKNSLKETLTNPRELIDDIQMLFLIHWITGSVFTYIDREQLIIFFVVGIILLIRYFIQHVGKILKNLRVVIVIAIIGRIIIEYDYIFSSNFLITFSTLVFVFVILKNLLLKIADTAFHKRIHISKLKPGMIWDKYLIETSKEIKPSEQYKKNMGGKVFLEPSVEGLTKKEIRRIKRAYKNKKLTIDCLDVSSKTPFAHFLFAATLLTMLLGGSLLTYILPFLN